MKHPAAGNARTDRYGSPFPPPPMNVQQFLLHHGVFRNPFADEDAQTDSVFREHCLDESFHPCWDKLRGDPAEPSTAVVFGGRGSGKTALRLQIVEHVAGHNRKYPDRRAFLIEYGDFGRLLDCFLGRARRRDMARRLADWKVSDHLDAILSLGVTRLVDCILAPPRDAEAVDCGTLTRDEARDLLLLAACYDQSPGQGGASRWERLRKTLRFCTRRARWPLVLGLMMTVVAVAAFSFAGGIAAMGTPWPYAVAGMGWLPWWLGALPRWWLARGVVKRLRVLRHRTSFLRCILARFLGHELASHPLPRGTRNDDPFARLRTFQALLRALGYGTLIVLVDGVEETEVFHSSPDGLRAWLLRLLDGELMKQPGVGFKLLLPSLSLPGVRGALDAYTLAQLEKRNFVPSLDWSGQMLYDVVAARLWACGGVALGELFDGEVTEDRLTTALGELRGPRESLRFLNDVLIAHSNQHTSNRPNWRISASTLEAVLARYRDA